MRLVLFFALVSLGLALTYDGCSYGLMPAAPEIGREKGCYTAIELYVGAKRPTWIRSAEQLGALGCMVLAVLVARRARRAAC